MHIIYGPVHEKNPRQSKVMRRGPKIPDISDNEIKRLLIEDGFTDRQAANILGISRMTVSRIRHSLGITAKPHNVSKRPLSEEQINLMRALYKEGLNDYEVSAKLNIGRNRLREWRNSNGIHSKSLKKNLKEKADDILRDLKFLTYSSVANKYGVARSSISRIAYQCNNLRPAYRPAHRKEMSDYILTSRQKEILIGDLFGDGGLVRTSDRSAYFQYAQCIEQEMFALWKAREFLPLTTHITYDRKWNKVTVGGSTCRQLGGLYKEFYPDSSFKKLTSEHVQSLTPLGMAVWYMGDGSVNRNTGLFHVGLQIDLPPIASVLSSVFGLTFLSRRYAREWHLRVMEPEKFFRIIGPHILTKFIYKIPEKYRHYGQNDITIEELSSDLKDMIVVSREQSL